MGPSHLRSGHPGAPPAALLLLTRAPPARPLLPLPPPDGALRGLPVPLLAPFLPLALFEPSRCCLNGEGPRTDPELLLVLAHPVEALALLEVPKVGDGLQLLLKVLPAAPGGLPLLPGDPLPGPDPVLGPTVESPSGRWGFRLLPLPPSAPLLVPVLVLAGPCGGFPALLLGPVR
jgi:hypothetical protein